MSNILDNLDVLYTGKEFTLIKKAYSFAKEAHAHQKRASGEEYFTHPCAVASILLDLYMDSNTIMAAFLHDVLEDTFVSADDIKREFNEEVFELVEGVTKLDKIEFKSQEEEQAENFKKIFVSMAKDIMLQLPLRVLHRGGIYPHMQSRTDTCTESRNATRVRYLRSLPFQQIDGDDTPSRCKRDRLRSTCRTSCICLY